MADKIGRAVRTLLDLLPGKLSREVAVVVVAVGSIAETAVLMIPGLPDEVRGVLAFVVAVATIVGVRQNVTPV